MIQFADDIAIFCRSPRLNDCLNAVQCSLNNVSKYLLDRNLSISPTKSQLVIFTRKQFDPLSVFLRLDADRIHSTTSAKFLGIILDHKLLFNTHLNHILRKGKRILGLIKSLRSSKWGADPPTLITIYRALIRSSFEYGSLVFFSNNFSLLEKLSRVQYQALRLALGFRNSTPTNVILAEAGETPLKIRFKYLANRYILKCFSFKDSIPLEKLYTLHDTLSRKNPHNIKALFPLYCAFITVSRYKSKIYSSPLPSLTYSFPYNLNNCNLPIDTTLALSLRQSSNPNHDLQSLLLSDFANKIIFYTDGSKKDSFTYVGLSIYCHENLQSEQFKISCNASVFSAEAIGIRLALQSILEQEIKQSIIFSDSLSVLLALTSSHYLSHSSPFLFEIKSLLNEIENSNLNTKLCWIPTHCGIAGNEKADKLAKEAISTGIFLPQRPPYTDFHQVIKQARHDSTHRFFEAAGKTKGKIYHELMYAPQPIKPWYYNCRNESREFITTISRMRSNHFNLNESLHRKNYIDSPLCECNSDSETLDHVFWNCEKYAGPRSTLLKLLAKKKLHPPFSTFALLASAPLNIIRLLYAFLKSSKLSI